MGACISVERHVKTSRSPGERRNSIQTRLDKARKLQNLDLSDLQIDKFPEEATSLPLKALDISRTPFVILPELSGTKIARVTAKDATLRNCPADHWPSTLTQLTVPGNQLTAESIQGLPPSLKQLDFSRNPLLHVPQCLLNGTLMRLEVLHLSSCGLESVPTGLSQLPGLIELHLDGNKLTTLALQRSSPDAAEGGWQGLAKLEVLTAKDNRLAVAFTSIPDDLLALPRLSSLDLAGNSQLTARDMLSLPGYKQYEARRTAKINKGIAGDVHMLQDRSVCGLDR